MSNEKVVKVNFKPTINTGHLGMVELKYVSSWTSWIGWISPERIPKLTEFLDSLKPCVTDYEI